MVLSKHDIIKQFIAAYNAFDIETMLSLLHPEIEFKNISGGEVNAQTEGKEEFEKLARQSAALFKERKQIILSYEEEDDTAVVEISYHATVAENLPGSNLQSGDTLELKGRSEYIFKEGLISSIIDES